MTKTEQNKTICKYCKHPAHCGHSCMDEECDCNECNCKDCDEIQVELGYN